MEMKKINAGKLRAIGYDAGKRLMRVELDDGTILQYDGVTEELWRRFSSSGAAWSFYRDNIEEEFSSQRITGGGSKSHDMSALDALFRQK